VAKKKVTVVLFHDDEAGGYTAIMPTFPYCTTQGETVAEAMSMAKESLELSLQEPTDWDLFDLEHAYSEHVVVGTVEIDLPPHPATVESKGDAAAPDMEDEAPMLSPAMLNSILQQAGITKEEFDRIAGEIL
jgi:predicted RNase H-like HicB family nuclease